MLHENVLAGLLTRDALAAQLGVHPRTLFRYERNGLPSLKLGATRLFDPARVREWIERQTSEPAPVKRGRPRRV